MDAGYDAMIAATAPGKSNPPRVLSFSDLGAGPARPEALVGLGFGIDYRDGEGRETRRWVKIIGVKMEPKLRLSAYSYTDKGARTLRPEGILAVIDGNGRVETREVFFARFGLTGEAESRVRVYPAVITRAGDGARVVVPAFPGISVQAATPGDALKAAARDVADRVAAGGGLPDASDAPSGAEIAWIAAVLARTRVD